MEDVSLPRGKAKQVQQLQHRHYTPLIHALYRTKQACVYKAGKNHNNPSYNNDISNRNAPHDSHSTHEPSLTDNRITSASWHGPQQ